MGRRLEEDDLELELLYQRNLDNPFQSVAIPLRNFQ